MKKIETLKEETQDQYYRFADIFESDEGYKVFLNYTTPGSFDRVDTCCENIKSYKTLIGAKKAALRYTEKNLI